MAQSAAVTLSTSVDAQYILFDAEEREVIAEAPLAAGQRARLSLRAGTYVVKKRSTSDLRVGRIVLKDDDDRELRDEQLESVPFVRLANKGSLGDGWFSTALGQSGGGLHPHFPAAQLGLEWAQGRWLWGAEIGVSTGTHNDRALPVRWTEVIPRVHGMFTLRLAWLELGAGPALGVSIINESAPGDPRRWALGISGALRARVGPRIRPNISLFIIGELSMLAVRATDRVLQGAPLPFDLTGFASTFYGLGFRIGY
jgi:hypothetical protein